MLFTQLLNTATGCCPMAVDLISASPQGCSIFSGPAEHRTASGLRWHRSTPAKAEPVENCPGAHLPVASGPLNAFSRHPEKSQTVARCLPLPAPKPAVFVQNPRGHNERPMWPQLVVSGLQQR